MNDLIGLIENAKKGSKRHLARLISLIENNPSNFFKILKTGNCRYPKYVIGFTGPPGCGKSTTINKFISILKKRYREGKIAVLSVDPSSPISGGAILGDRIRMMEHSGDDRVFIRSFSNRGHLGGLIRCIREILFIFGMCGYEWVILETVGVGQSEVEVFHVADIIIVLVSPDMGDEIQMLKAGLLEVGDIFAVSKSDKKGADITFKDLKSTLEMDDKETPVIMISAKENKGIDNLLDMVIEELKNKQDEIKRKRVELEKEEIKTALLNEAISLLSEAIKGEDLDLSSYENGEALLSVLKRVQKIVEGRKK